MWSLSYSLPGPLGRGRMKIFKATRDHQNLSGKEHPFEGDVGPGENLSGANLRGVDLTRTNLSKADLAVADLGRADLSGADLRGATHWDRADWRNASCFHRRKPKWPAGMDPKKFGITVYRQRKRSRRIGQTWTCTARRLARGRLARDRLNRSRSARRGPSRASAATDRENSHGSSCGSGRNLCQPFP